MEYFNLNKQKVSALAKTLAKSLSKGDIVLLYGELGSGKTFFVNKVCKYKNVKSIVNSPSYVLLNEYECEPQHISPRIHGTPHTSLRIHGTPHISPHIHGGRKGGGILSHPYELLTIYHYDLYRLSSADEAIELGILERIDEGITFIEWPELIEDFIPKKRIEIFFEHNGLYRNIRLEVKQ